VPGLYAKLRSHFGFQDWWPGETSDEIVIGAILTQQTTWKNVEKALAGLKRNGGASILNIAKMHEPDLRRILRPTGYYRQKAERLKNISSYIIEKHGTLSRMFAGDVHELRDELLSLDGIGKETADSILLYAAGIQVFVVDSYTRRAMHRIYGIKTDMEYDKLRGYFEKKVQKELEVYKDFHAQFVELGKNYCKSIPLCLKCPIVDYCRYGKSIINTL